MRLSIAATGSRASLLKARGFQQFVQIHLFALTAPEWLGVMQKCLRIVAQQIVRARLEDSKSLSRDKVRKVNLFVNHRVCELQSVHEPCHIARCPEERSYAVEEDVPPVLFIEHLRIVTTRQGVQCIQLPEEHSMERRTIKKRKIDRNLDDLFDELRFFWSTRLSESFCNYTRVERKYVNDAWKVAHRLHQTENLPNLFEREAIYVVDCDND